MSYEYLVKRFRKLDVLGGSGKNKVYLAKDTVTGQFVVLKYISKESAMIYQSLKTVQHRNLVHILFVAEGSKNALVVMEYVSGITLADYCEEKGTVSEEESLDIVQQILEGLCVIHQQKLVHRDINPHNIIKSFDGVVKIIDFDIGRTYKEKQGRDTEFLGTAGYAAPEQFGFLQSDARTDIYGVGVVLNVMLTGKFPNEHCYGKGKMGKVIQKCTQVEPKLRYQSAEKLLKVIQSICVQKKRAEKITHAVSEFLTEESQKKAMTICQCITVAQVVVKALGEVQRSSK